VLRFAGFALDRERVELRRPDGEAVKLRPQTFAMLTLFASNAGRALSKQELMDAIWPNVHVSDDSLFKCIRELRTALGDDRRQLIKLVSGHGYMFDAQVTSEPVTSGPVTREPAGGAGVGIAEPPSVAAAELAKVRTSRFMPRGPTAFAAVAGLGAVLGLAIAAPIFGPPDLFFTRTPPTIAVMPIGAADGQVDGRVAAMAAAVTGRLVDGMTRIDNVRVLAPPSQASSAKPASASSTAADFVVTGELRKDEHAWTLQARMIKTATQEVQPAASISVGIKEPDLQLQQSRLAAGVGHQLALRINTLLNSTAADSSSPPGAAKAAIEQATASIMQTTRERFAAAQAMLEKALTDEPNNADLQVALAALQLRGIQMVWYSPAESAAAEQNAKAMLERAVRTRPSSIPVLQAYCRFLNATNEFVESLVACARTLAFDPWDGMALYHIGLSQLPLGRFEDALATFKQADRYDTPPVSRWTWLLGMGVSYLMMGRDEEALPWLQRSITITPASGRSLILLAAAYQRLGRTDEANTALTQGLKLRPGSTVSNVGIPTKNVSAAYMEARGRIEQALIAAGLPER
jgi:DNA-binding winged helix-turn-helix (wHTH) protein/tetratricopeptide (TPR) repeat protein/TolB-like protein